MGKWGQTSAFARARLNEGNRIEQQIVSGGTTTTTTTVSVGSLEQDTAVSTSGASSTTRTQYCYANGRRVAAATNGTLFVSATMGQVHLVPHS